MFSVVFQILLQMIQEGPNSVVMGGSYSQAPYGDFWIDYGEQKHSANNNPNHENARRPEKRFFLKTYQNKNDSSVRPQTAFFMEEQGARARARRGKGKKGQGQGARGDGRQGRSAEHFKAPLTNTAGSPTASCLGNVHLIIFLTLSLAHHFHLWVCWLRMSCTLHAHIQCLSIKSLAFNMKVTTGHQNAL